MDILPHLKLMVEKNASDLFFSTGTAVQIKIEGRTYPIGKDRLNSNAVKQLAYSIMSDQQVKTFEATLESNLAIAVKGVGRFRVNVFQQRGEVAMVIRYIKSEIPDFASLHLPPVLQKLIMEVRGLVLVVGATGSGKSTTLASMIDVRNAQRSGHILTVEDPIEFMHKHKKSVVNQREVGLDTLSYSNALKNAMREAPDVILIGEIRDEETMRHAVTYAETGHLCLATLHANNAYQTMDRILNFFPANEHQQLRLELAINLKAIVCQRLIRGISKSYVPAVEVMLNSPYVSELIQKGEFATIREAMEKSTNIGMQTFDQALFKLYEEGKISLEEALRHADSRNNLALKIRLAKGEPASASRSSEDGGLGVMDDGFH